MLGRNLLLYLLTAFLGMSVALGQQPNSCGVIAKMTPAGDSIVTGNTGVLFENASINATDYKFIMDGFPYLMNTPLSIGIDVGLTEIKLVAYNGSCTDTTVVYYFRAGEFPVDPVSARKVYGSPQFFNEMKGISLLKNGGQLLFGYRYYSDYLHLPQIGFLIKTQAGGCVEWSRKLPVNWNFLSTVNDAKEANDGSIFMVAEYLSRPQFLTKLDPAGNILWNRVIDDGSIFPQLIMRTVITPDNGVITVSTPYAVPAFYITRFDANGQILWQRHLDYNMVATNGFRNLLIKDGYLYVAGGFSYNTVTNYGSFISKFDISNGQTVWAKQYNNSSDYIGFSDMVSMDTTIVLSIIKSTGVSTRPTIGGVMRIDTAGNVKDVSVIAEIHTPNPLTGPYGLGATHITVSGKNYYIISSGGYPLTLQGDGFNTKQIRLDSTLQVQWVKSSGGVGQPKYYYNVPGPRGGAIIAGHEFSKLVGNASFGQMFAVVPVDSSLTEPNTNCYFFTQAWEIFQPTVTSTPIQWVVDEPANNTAVDMDLNWADFYPELRFKCPDFVDSCGYLKISGPRDICNISQTYTFLTHKNKKCGQPTRWRLSDGMQMIRQTDSSITVQFNSFGRFVLHGSNVLSCSPVEDSIVIVAASKTPPLELGPDLDICPGNTKTLHAGSKFLRYEWQNGSTDSVITVNQPGKYWVKVTDSCDNVLSDTVNIQLAPPIPFSVGPDREICEKDTVHLDAPAGFMNYAWSPAYRINTQTGPSVIVSPITDTQYTVMAEKTPGCFAYDTVKIVVHPILPLQAGSDTSFCTGDSTIFDAGAAFATYKWNTGATTAQIVARQAGKYSVIATSNFGCRSFDTVEVVALFALPQPSLNDDPVICDGAIRILDPGAGFVTYRWNNGSTGATISVSSLGDYFVQVTNQQGCKASDTVHIDQLQYPPSGFLPADTALCSYESLQLKPIRNFNSYLWNNGSTNSSLLVNRSGLYSVEVKDQYGCIGKDSILITAKIDCLQGVFVPNAFTPNSDGRNDKLRPIIYGRIVQYEFTIFNRWGAVVFQSKDPTRGWDGLINGQPQQNGVFVWSVTYQLDGQTVQQQKGTVTLIR